MSEFIVCSSLLKTQYLLRLRSSLIGLSFLKKKLKINFQDGRHGCHLGFPIGTILAIFDIQVTPMLPTRFQVNWPFGSGEEVNNKFSRWPPFLIGRFLTIFNLHVAPILPPKLRVNWPFVSGEEAKNDYHDGH